MSSLTSAGVGRTGTYICLDYVMQFIQERALDERLDILKFVLRMRENRCRMVQTDVSVTYLVVLVHFAHKQSGGTRLFSSYTSHYMSEDVCAHSICHSLQSCFISMQGIMHW